MTLSSLGLNGMGRLASALAMTLSITLGLSLAQSALAQEATLRKNLAERLPALAKIDEISKTPLTGIFEIRVNGSDIYYTDAEGNYLIQGALIDLKQKRNLTEERIDKLSAIDFDALPLKNAFTQVRGNGKRKLAIFADPNCGYCKRFEKDLAKIDNVTIYHVLYPILGEDSQAKAKNIWCAKDKAKTWNDWMLSGVTPPAVKCDTAVVDANVEFGKKNRITGTPTLFFADNTRVPGAIDAKQIEKLLSAVH
jgi:thiol:disulfide interchange protein DsbC